MKDGGRETTGRFVSSTNTESRGGEGEGGGRVCWPMEEAGNSLSRNFSYRTVVDHPQSKELVRGPPELVQHFRL